MTEVSGGGRGGVVKDREEIKQLSRDITTSRGISNTGLILFHSRLYRHFVIAFFFFFLFLP